MAKKTTEKKADRHKPHHFVRLDPEAWAILQALAKQGDRTPPRELRRLVMEAGKQAGLDNGSST